MKRALLQASEVRFRLLVSGALDETFLADASGKFVMVNQQACACLGYNEQELLALSTEDIEVGHTDEEIVQIFKDLSQEGARKELILPLCILTPPTSI